MSSETAPPRVLRGKPVVVDLLQEDGHAVPLEPSSGDAFAPLVTQPAHLAGISEPKPRPLGETNRARPRQGETHIKSARARSRSRVAGGRASPRVGQASTAATEGAVSHGKRPETISPRAIASNNGTRSGSSNSDNNKPADSVDDAASTATTTNATASDACSFNAAGDGTDFQEENPLPAGEGLDLSDSLDATVTEDDGLYTRPLSGRGAVQDEALNITLDAESQRIANYYHSLRKFLKECRRNRRYLEAEETKKKIDEIRAMEAQRRLDALKARHAREIHALNEAYRQELEAFRRAREEKFQEFTNECQQQLQVLMAQHEYEEQTTREAEKAKLEERPRPSHELLTLRRIEENLSKTDSFREAFEVRRRADKLEQEEMLAAQNGSHTRITKALAALYRTHSAELAALKQRHEIKETKIRRALIIDEEQLTRKFFNLHAALVHSQKLEIARLKGLKHYIPPPSRPIDLSKFNPDEPLMRHNDHALPPIRGLPCEDGQDTTSASSFNSIGDSVLFEGDAPMRDSEQVSNLGSEVDETQADAARAEIGPELYGSPTARRIRHMLRRPTTANRSNTSPGGSKSTSATSSPRSTLSKMETKGARKRLDMRDILYGQEVDDGNAELSTKFREDMNPIEVLQLDAALDQQQAARVQEILEKRSTHLSSTSETSPEEGHGNVNAEGQSLDNQQQSEQPAELQGQQDPQSQSPATARKSALAATAPGMPPPRTAEALRHADFVRNSNRRRLPNITFTRSRTARGTSEGLSKVYPSICPLRPTESDLIRMKEAEERARRRELEAQRRHLEVSRRFAQRKRAQQEEEEQRREEQRRLKLQQEMERARLEEQRRLQEAQKEEQRRHIEIYRQQQEAIARNEKARQDYEVNLQRVNAELEQENAKRFPSTHTHPRLSTLYQSPRVQVDVPLELVNFDPSLRPPPHKLPPGRLRWATPPPPVPLPEYLRMGGREEVGTIAVPLAEQDEVVQSIMGELEEKEKVRTARAAADYRRRQQQGRLALVSTPSPSPSPPPPPLQSLPSETQENPSAAVAPPTDRPM